MGCAPNLVMGRSIGPTGTGVQRSSFRLPIWWILALTLQSCASEDASGRVRYGRAQVGATGVYRIVNEDCESRARP